MKSTRKFPGVCVCVNKQLECLDLTSKLTYSKSLKYANFDAILARYTLKRMKTLRVG